MSLSNSPVLKCSPSVRPRFLYPFLVIVVGLWTIVFVSTALGLAVSAFERRVPDQGASSGLFCTCIGFLPALFAVSFLQKGRRVFWIDREHGSLTCLRERWRFDRVEWTLPLTDVTEVACYDLPAHSDQGNDRGVFVILCTGQPVLVSQSIQHGEVISAIIGCPFKQVTRGLGLLNDQTESVISRMRPPPEVIRMVGIEFEDER